MIFIHFKKGLIALSVLSLGILSISCKDKNNSLNPLWLAGLQTNESAKTEDVSNDSTDNTVIVDDGSSSVTPYTKLSCSPSLQIGFEEGTGLSAKDSVDSLTVLNLEANTTYDSADTNGAMFFTDPYPLITSVTSINIWDEDSVVGKYSMNFDGSFWGVVDDQAKLDFTDNEITLSVFLKMEVTPNDLQKKDGITNNSSLYNGQEGVWFPIFGKGNSSSNYGKVTYPTLYKPDQRNYWAYIKSYIPTGKAVANENLTTAMHFNAFKKDETGKDIGFGGTSSADGSIVEGEWVHAIISIKKDSSNPTTGIIQYYINGQKSGGEFLKSNMFPLLANEDKLYVGGNYSSQDNVPFYRGKMDQLEIYPCGFSSDDANLLYQTYMK